MKPISLNLRSRIMDAVDRHDMIRQQIADRFAVSLGLVKKLVRQRKLIGSIKNLHHRAGWKRIVSPKQETRIRNYLKEHPGATFKEIRAAFALPCSLVADFFILRRMGFTYTKIPPLEKMWSKVKRILRSLAARTSEKPNEAIRIALDSVTSHDAQGMGVFVRISYFLK